MKPSGFKMTATLLCAAAVSTVFAAARVYENDLSNRTSAGTVPTAGWHVKNYAYPAELAYRYICAPGALTPATPYVGLASIQDGWIKGVGTATASANLGTSSLSLYCDVTTNQVARYAGANDGTNPFLTFYYPQGNVSSVNESMVAHPIGNAFSNGILRISADLRMPDVWHGGAALVVRPMFAKAMAPDNLDYDLYPLEFGFYNGTTAGQNSYASNKGNQIKPIVNGGVPDASEPTKKMTDMMTWSPGSNYWYRMILTMNLDAATWSAEMYKQTIETPAFGSADGSSYAKYLKNASGSFYRGVTDATGPISGIALRAYNINRCYYSTAYHWENIPRADNLKIEWKAPGTADFISCYENDFATCRYRTISPAPSASTAYAPGSAGVEDVFSSYPTTDKSLLNAKYIVFTVPQGGSYASAYLGDPGIDGWRRLNAQNGQAFGTVHNWGGDGTNVLRVVATKDNSIQSAIFVNRFKAVASGKVRLSADIRPPTAWASASSREISLLLGEGGMYTAADGNAYLGSLAVRAGIGNATDAEFNPAHSSGATLTASLAATLTGKNWYRVVVTADLTAQTYDYELYDMGSASVSADAEPSAVAVFSQTGIAFRSPVTDLATFGLYVAGVGYSPAEEKSVCLDNVKIWTLDANDAATLVYANDFKTRMAYGAVAAQIVDDAPDRLGADGWFRRGAGFGRAEIAGETNRCLALSPEKDSVCLVHELGKTISSGTFNLSVDIRPPSYWTLTNGFAHVMLGGEEFFRGEIGTNTAGGVSLRNFEKAAALRFGVGHNAGASTMLGVFRESTGCAYSGSTLLWSDVNSDRTTASWYRYKAEVDLGKGQWALKVYKLGPDLPSLSTPLGEQVFAADGLDLGEIPADGITCIGVKASGCTSGDRGWAEAGGGVLFDNFSVTTPDGTVLTIR